MTTFISNMRVLFQRKSLMENTQVAYEHRICQNIFSGYIKYFMCVMFYKYVIQFRFGYNYEQSMDYVFDNDMVFACGISFILISLTIWILTYCLGFSRLEDRYMKEEKFKPIIFEQKYLNKVKRWYYITDFTDILFWSSLFILFPVSAILAAFSIGGIFCFLCLYLGYFYPVKANNLASVGYSLFAGAAILMIMNLFMDLGFWKNIICIISMIGSIIIIMVGISDMKDDYEEIQERWPGRTKEEYERVLEAYSYFNSYEINYHIRNIIFELTRILSGDIGD